MDSEDIVRKFHQKRGRIRDPEKIHPGSGSRIQGVKKHRIPDPDPQHCANFLYFICRSFTAGLLRSG
jgi:hypothetical protein